MAYTGKSHWTLPSRMDGGIDRAVIRIMIMIFTAG